MTSSRGGEREKSGRGKRGEEKGSFRKKITLVWKKRKGGAIPKGERGWGGVSTAYCVLSVVRTQKGFHTRGKKEGRGGSPRGTSSFRKQAS